MAMATVKLTCQRCEREFVVKKKCRNCTEADGFKDWASHHIRFCEDCQHEMEYEKSVEETDNLPALEGTKRQIRWATVIRANFKKTNAGQKGFDVVYELICKHCREAAWWIENQDNLANAFAKLLREDAELMHEYQSCIKRLK